MQWDSWDRKNVVLNVERSGTLVVLIVELYSSKTTTLADLKGTLMLVILFRVEKHNTSN